MYEGHYPKGSAAVLRRYARVPLFGTVGIDSTHYRPASDAMLREYAAALPPRFPCTMKVWNQITAAHWSKYQDPKKRGGPNPDFLNADMFIEAVAAPVAAAFAEHISTLLLEFSTIPYQALSAAAFLTRLDSFLSAVPRTVPLSVEVRNPEFLVPEYFAILREHGVAHCFNHWARMPPLAAQLDLPDVVTAGVLVARLMMGAGGEYETLKRDWDPFDRLIRPDPELRQAVVRLARLARAVGLPCHIIVSNTAEGCAPLTVLELARLLAQDANA